jgi:hypothetical protein
VDGVISGRLFVPGKGLFRVRYAVEGLHVVEEVTPVAEETPTGDVVVPPVLWGPAPDGYPYWTAASFPSPCAYSASATHVVIDLMVAYNQDALAKLGGLSALAAQVDAEIAFSNMCYANSLVDAELNLVRLQPVTYTQTASLATDLANLRNASDGLMDEIPALRDSYGADLVSLWLGNANSAGTGVAFMACPSGVADATYGYSVVAINSPSGMTHEIVTTWGPFMTRPRWGLRAFSYSMFTNSPPRGSSIAMS